MSRIIHLLLGLVILSSCSGDDWASGFGDDPSADTIAIIRKSTYMAVVGDIQTYTYDASLMPYFKASMEWLTTQHDCFDNIDMVIQVGDLTDNNAATEWSRAIIVMRPVAEKIPMIAVTGNHDYDWQRTNDENFALINSRLSSRFNQYLLPLAPRLKLVSLFEAGRHDNAIYQAELGGRLSQFIALEFAPRPEAVEWARQHIEANPSMDTYIITHEWLYRSAVRLDWGNSYAKRQFSDPSLATDPETMWKTIVKPYDNVIAVICGHNSFMEVREDLNDAGRKVPQILFNLQYQPNGGDSMLQLWEFPAESDSVKIRVYNTMAQTFCPDSLTSYSFSRARAM